MREDTPWVVIGEIARPHGIRGDVRVLYHTDFPERFKSLTRVYLQKPGEEPQPHVVTSVRVRSDAAICHLQGIDSRQAAEALRGMLLVVPREEAIKLPEGQYYLFELVGLSVYTEEGEYLGRIREVLQPGANDVYVVESGTGGKDILLPAIRDVVQDVDIDRGQMTVRILPGLLEL